MNTYNIIKIETAPLSDAEIQLAMPEFTAPANYSKPDAIAKSIAEQKARFMEKAAFDPTTGRIVAIGVLPVVEGVPGDPVIIASDSPKIERVMIKMLLDLTPRETGDEPVLVGWYLEKFLLPFICKRSWKLGLETARMMGMHDTVDLTEIYSCGDQFAHPKLEDALAFLLDRPRVTEPTVAELLKGDKDEEVAERITRDLELLRLLGQRMGVIK